MSVFRITAALNVDFTSISPLFEVLVDGIVQFSSSLSVSDVFDNLFSYSGTQPSSITFRVTNTVADPTQIVIIQDVRINGQTFNTGGDITLNAGQPQQNVDTSLYGYYFGQEEVPSVIGNAPPGSSGTSGNDVLKGSNNANTLSGLDGHDNIKGYDGDDLVYGGAGNDSVFGGLGNDLVSGEAGDDYAYGNNGDDLLYGGDGSDRLYGGVGGDTLSGNAGRDFIYGEDGHDIIFGGADNDRIFGGADHDNINGGGRQ